MEHFSKKLELADRKAFYQLLQTYCSPHKVQLFHSNIENRTKHFTVVLEDVYHSPNANAVIRTAEILGIHDVHIVEENNFFKLNKDVVMGSAKWLHLHYYKKAGLRMSDCFQKLREQNYKIIATSPGKNQLSLEDLEIDEKTALIFGAEKQGLSNYVLDNADQCVTIPMYGFTESYNISVSAAICLYTLIHRMRRSGIDWSLSEEEQLNEKIRWALGCLKKPELLVSRLIQDHLPQYYSILQAHDY